MQIQRNARVDVGNDEIGRVTHVIVDPVTREVTNIVVGQGESQWTIPISAVSHIDGEYITLHGTRADYRSDRFERGEYRGLDDENLRDQSERRALHGGAPLLDATDDAVVVADAGRTASPATAQPVGLPVEHAVSGETERLDLAGGEPFHLQLREEKLRITMEEVQAGVVLVHRRVVERTEMVEVPVREEQLVLEVRPGSGTVRVGDRDLHEGETIEVPLMRERVIITKEPVVTDEIVIRKELFRRVETVQETLRTEELVVDDPSALVSGAQPGSEFEEMEPAFDMPEPMAPIADIPLMSEGRPMMFEESTLGGDTAGDAASDAELRASRDRSLDEAEARLGQKRPSHGGELNPGAAEYAQELPNGPAGTEHAVGPSSAESTHHNPLGNAPAQHDMREEVARQMETDSPSRPPDYTPNNG